MKVKAVFDTKAFSSKPAGNEVGAIINRMTIDKAKHYNLTEVRKKVLKGYTIRPSICGAKENSWQAQQVFMIDIDNEAKFTDDIVLSDYVKLVEGKKNIVKFLVGSEQHKSYNDIIDHCKKINLIPNFIYLSFNHSEAEQHKFRLVFVLDKPITDVNLAKEMQLYLMDSIGDNVVDEKCKNLNRIYYGGKKIVYNSNIILKSEHILRIIKNEEKEKEKNEETNEVTLSPYKKVYTKLYRDNITPFDSNNENIEAIKNRDIEYLRNKFVNNDTIYFENKQEFLDYIRKEIDLSELLGIDNCKSFNCIFHDDRKPSAGIFMADDGAWIYHCFACEISYNIINVIEILANINCRPDVYKFIKQIYNLEIMETEWQKKQKEILEDTYDALTSTDFLDNCPQTEKNIKRSKHYLKELIMIAIKNINHEEFTDDDGNIIFFASAEYIAREMGLSEKSVKRVYQKIAFYAYHKLIKKIGYYNIPKRLRKRTKEMMESKDQFRHINYLAIPSLNAHRFKEIEERAKSWKENNYNMAGISREMFFRAEGKEIADELYPQFDKITKKVNGKDVTEDRTTTKASDDRTNYIVSAIFELIDELGYATEKKVVAKLMDKYKYKTTEMQIKKSLSSILNDYDLKRCKANKVLKEKYKIESKGYPYIIIEN